MIKISKKIGFWLKMSNLMGVGSEAYSGWGALGHSPPHGPVKFSGGFQRPQRRLLSPQPGQIHELAPVWLL